jgi:hypothetical protein
MEFYLLCPGGLKGSIPCVITNRIYLCTVIDGQVGFVGLVHLQMDNLRIFLRQQTDKRQISVSTMRERQTE